MRDEIIVAGSVAGISDPSAPGDLKLHSFVIAGMHFRNGSLPHFAASGITGAETVNLWKMTAGTWVKVFDGAGAAVQLTATNPQESLYSEGVYGVTKSSGTGIVVTVQMP